MRIDAIPNLVRDSKRLNEIVTVLAKYGLAPWLGGVKSEWIQNAFKSKDGQAIAELSQGARLRMAFTELGTSFIKLGQVLSTRADLVGPDITRELAELQSGTPADPPEVVREVITSELGSTPEELFAKFDDKAVASASIGQVHFATLFDGTEVVVKVQHPGIEEKVESDLEIMKQLAAIADRHSSQARQYRPIETMEEFSRILAAELDFTRERRNLETFNNNFANEENVRIPQPYADLSSRRVLTMDRLVGVSLSKADQLGAEGQDLAEVANQGANIFLEMIFRDGFFHADPHPGNIFVLTNGAIGLLDCGMVGRIDEKMREQFEDMLVAAADKDGDALCRSICDLGVLPKNFDYEDLRVEIEEFLSEFATQRLDEFDLGGALNRMMEIIRRFNIVLPSRITLLIKVLVMLEGTSKELNPSFSLAEIIEPYRSKIVSRRLSPQRLLRKAKRNILDWNRLVESAPRDIADILMQVKRGKFDVHLEHRKLDAVVNRLVMGILTAALFLGSALLWSQNVKPTLGGVSIAGFAGCIVAVVLGVRLILAVKRSGNVDSEM